MFKYKTLARPYSEAIFELAIKNNKISYWQYMLNFLIELIKNKKVIDTLYSLNSSKNISEMFIKICGGQLDICGQNLIRLLVDNNRLNILPDIYNYFIYLCRKNESITEIEVISANILSEKHLSEISFAMENRLSSKVKINLKIDKSLIGGLIIRLNDVVIDSSIRNYLEKFKAILKKY